MKSLIYLASVLGILFTSQKLIANQFYTDYYRDLPIEIKQVKPFSIPDKNINLSDRGAKGDGLTLNTELIQKTIDELSLEGGGHLIIPQGYGSPAHLN